MEPRYPDSSLEWFLWAIAVALGISGFAAWFAFGYFLFLLRREGLFARTDKAKQLRASLLRWLLITGVLFGSVHWLEV